jgi:copper homeostasis protein
MEYIIEIATTDYYTTKAAIDGGADRIELCAALSEGGITPSFGTIKQCREAFDIPLFPIIRPRGGDFLYSDSEFQIMKSDIGLCREAGCDGIVTGLLKNDGRMDIDRLIRLVELAYPMEVTVHRAFDRCIDPFEAMEQIIEAGCQRILTSGQQPTAPEGMDLIASLIREAGNRIVIMPGSGVRKENIRMLLEKTGATEFHTSLRSRRKSKMEFIHPSFMNSEESYFNPAIDPEEIRSIKNILG